MVHGHNKQQHEMFSLLSHYVAQIRQKECFSYHWNRNEKKHKKRTILRTKTKKQCTHNPTSHKHVSLLVIFTRSLEVRSTLGKTSPGQRQRSPQDPNRLLRTTGCCRIKCVAYHTHRHTQEIACCVLLKEICILKSISNMKWGRCLAVISTCLICIPPRQ